MNREALEALREKVEAGEFSRDDAWNALGTKELTGYADRAFLGSLDAAKALHDAVLPGWDWSLRKTVEGHLCEVNLPFSKAVHLAASFDNNPARAWLLAILSALLAEGGE